MFDDTYKILVLWFIQLFIYWLDIRIKTGFDGIPSSSIKITCSNLEGQSISRLSLLSCFTKTFQTYSLIL